MWMGGRGESLPWCGNCDPEQRTDTDHRPCPRCHPLGVAAMDTRGWCGDCDRRTRLTAAGQRCITCHPRAHLGRDPYQRKPWCRQCGKSDRMLRDATGTRKCPRCHPFGRAPHTWPMHGAPVGYAEQLFACEWLCHINPSFRRLGADELRIRLRRWFDAGWSPRDVEYALDHYPTGDRHTGESPLPTSDPKTIVHFIRRRLSVWRDEDDELLPPVSSLRESNRARRLHDQLQRADEWNQRAERAVPAPQSRHAHLARMIARNAATRARAARHTADQAELAARAVEQQRRAAEVEHWRQQLASLDPGPEQGQGVDSA